MQFRVLGGNEFEIPDEWWIAAGMKSFVRRSDAYLHCPDGKLPALPVIVVAITQVKPPQRLPSVTRDFRGFRRDGMDWALQHISSNTPLEPIRVLKANGETYRYMVYDGFHRFYASTASGYPSIPVVDVTGFTAR